MFIRKKVFAKAHRVWGGNLHTLIVGGAPLDLNLDKFFQGAGLKIFVGYGMSETSPLISGSLNHDRIKGEVGRPMKNIQVKLNAESEILVKGQSVFLGYWPNLDQSKEDFFNTQDIGEFTKNSNLVLRGRTKNLFVYTSGDKIFAEDIEYIAKKIEGLDEVCVVNTSNSKTPQLNLIYTGLDIEKKEILEYLCNRLPFFVSIHNIQKYFEEKLPRTHTLKFNRKILLEWSQQQSN